MDKRIAVTVPLEGYTLDEHAPLMREAEALGYRDAWSWEADGLDAFSPLAVAGLTSGLRLGTAIVNVFTRMRYCTPNGRIGFEEKGRPGTQKPGLYPWFDVPGHAPRELPVVCGHWSTLGLFMGLGIYAIDTGAVWGGKLTALELGPELRLYQVAGREVPASEIRRAS